MKIPYVQITAAHLAEFNANLAASNKVNLAKALAAEAAGLPFSLACAEGCEAADYEGAPTSISEALAAGWTGVTLDMTGLSWNFTATCPECAADEDSTVVDRQRGLFD